MSIRRGAPWISFECLAERLAERGDELPWRLRESISRLQAFLPDPALEEDFEEVHG